MKEIVRPEKTIVLSCKKGAWEASFSNREDALPITIPDLRRANRALSHGHRVYIRELNLRLKLARRRETEKAKSSAVKGTNDG